jgi:hypothetical protein
VKKSRVSAGAGHPTFLPPPPPSKQPFVMRPPSKIAAPRPIAAAAAAAAAPRIAALAAGGLSAVRVRTPAGVSGLLAVMVRGGVNGGVRTFALRTQWRDLGFFGDDGSLEYNDLTTLLGKKEVWRQTRAWPNVKTLGRDTAVHSRQSQPQVAPSQRV